MFRNPALYSSSNGCTVATVKYLFEKHKNLLKFQHDEYILDLATGDGNVTAFAILPNLPNDCKQITISDKSKFMLDYARKVDYFSTMQFKQLDIEAKGIPEEFSNKFDHIFHMFLLHWVKDTRQALQNIYKMLKPGGATFGIFFSESPADEALYAFSKNPRWSMYKHQNTTYYNNPKILEIYQNDLKKCGFVNYRLEPDDYIYNFPNEKELIDICVATNLAIETIPKQDLLRYIEEYMLTIKKAKVYSCRKGNNEEMANPQWQMKMLTLYAEKPVI